MTLENDKSKGSSRGTWRLTLGGNQLQIAYGTGKKFPQYGVLHLTDSYFRLNYGPGSDWGTSVILLPSFWSGKHLHHGAPVAATIEVPSTPNLQSVDANLEILITGKIASLNVSIQVRLSPPTENGIVAHVTTTVEGNIKLDPRPGEAFKPFMLSSMHISPTVWDTRVAYADDRVFSIPPKDWIIQPDPLVTAHTLELIGGTSEKKKNAPTIRVELDRRLQVAGWVTKSDNPDDDNVGLWVASDRVLPSWTYKIIATRSVLNPES